MSDAMNALLELMVRLRTGCPWDREQTFATIAPFTIEEAYEVADAIDRNDPQQLRDELGDLLFQIVFHSRMAEEKGWFDFTGVATSIHDKLVRLQLFPPAALRFDALAGRIAEDMWMPAHELIVNRSRNASEIEPALFLGHPRVKYNLKQQVAQLVAQLLRIIPIDRVRDFVRFFDGEGCDGRKCLLAVPGAAGSQPHHQFQQRVHGITHRAGPPTQQQ